MEKIVGYTLERHDCPGKLFCGVSPREISDAIKNELEMSDELPADERSVFTLTPIETTMEEIESMPDFEGW